MARIVQWERQIGRRLRLRDLSVLFAVVETGSMAKAAAQLGVSAPSVSAVIADLEHTLGVRLFDRGPKGVLPTPYAQALLARGRAAFDELRQGIRDIEFLSDPAAGEVRIGCPESVAAGFVLKVVERLTRRYPRMRLHVQQVFTPTVEFPDLYERKVDLVVARLVKLPVNGHLGDDLDAEVLFDDPFFVTVGRKSKWGRRRNVQLADLIDEPWVMTPLEALGGAFLKEAFLSRGLPPPRLSIASFSIHLRNNLVSDSGFVTALPRSVLSISREHYDLKDLPIRLTAQPSPVALVTLRHRTLGAAAQAFIRCAREVATVLSSNRG